MSIEPEIQSRAATPLAEPPTVSVIENELPTYRAISPGAIFALLLGLVAVLSYAHPFFLIFAVAAIVVGALADRKIQRMPDILTGQKLAQIGIALGLTFGLTSFTIDTVQSMLRKRAAAAFARQYETVLTKGAFEDAVWYGQNPDRRANTTPAKLVNEMKTKASDPRMFDMQTQVLHDLKDRLAEPEAAARFVEIEGHGDDGTNMVATALYEVHLPKRSTPGPKDTHALAILKGRKEKGKYEWWVEDVRFPYEPASYVAPEKPVDDGHGHDGGGGGGEHGPGDGHNH
ncbi:MAG: DUF4190 domain-containing protein [Isosphaeraceae bacterium]